MTFQSCCVGWTPPAEYGHRDRHTTTTELSSRHFSTKETNRRDLLKSSLLPLISIWKLTSDSVKKHQILKIGHFSFLPPLRHCGLLEKLTRGVERCGSKEQVDRIVNS